MVYVINATGNYPKDCPPQYDSWIDYWIKKRGLIPEWCRHCKTNTKELDGGHVRIVEQGPDGKWYYKGETLYIVPICRGCNNPNNQEIFSVSETDLVPVP
ncbi:MAG: hypothetical protein FWF97_00920 [Alphaproteobacteria bacterium]|nr:hypothetical protein [Alphaproteobacteria bacterium]